jgi:uncharacterized protein YbjT (DUF2867 family)
MILVTGATGFIGRHVVARLTGAGYDVRCLVRPAHKERTLPRGVRVYLGAGDLADLPALRVAMYNVDTVVHLASIWMERGQQTFDSVNRQGTINLVEAAREVGIARLIYLSYPGADGNSAYAFLRSKAQAEEVVRSSNLKFTILRPSWVYGPGDAWASHMAMVLEGIPFFFPMVGDGQARIQPLWVWDLALCIERCLSSPRTVGQTIALGGPGYLTIADALDAIAQTLNSRRSKVSIRAPVAYELAAMMERALPNPLLNMTAVDLLNVDTTTDLGSVTRNFGFEPARFADRLDYLRGQPWRRMFWRSLLGRRQ